MNIGDYMNISYVFESYYFHLTYIFLHFGFDI